MPRADQNSYATDSSMASNKFPSTISMFRRPDDYTLLIMQFGHQDLAGEDIPICTVGPPRSIHNGLKGMDRLFIDIISITEKHWTDSG